jgi:hypothetical protein
MTGTQVGDFVMTDMEKAAADRRRIDVHEAYELGYWSRKLGVH